MGRRIMGRRYVVRWNPPHRSTLFQRMAHARIMADASAFAAIYWSAR